MPTLLVNGKPTPHCEGESLRALLGRLALDPEQRGIAIAVNDEVVPRSAWDTRYLEPDDRVEILHAVQGG
jgi:sulfur carrier protein